MDYISIHKKEDFDKAIEILLTLTPGENVFGWDVIDSTAELPVDLNTIITPGNYIVHHYINGIDNKIISPVTLKVTTINSDLVQMIIVGSDTYQRNFNTSTNLFDGEWNFFNDGVTIYKGATAPPYPTTNTLWLKDDIESLLVKYDGTNWVPVHSSNYMDSTVYDVNNRRIDIMEYLKSELNKDTIMISSDAVANAVINTTTKIFTELEITTASIALGKGKCYVLGRRNDGFSLRLMSKNITYLSDNTKQWNLSQDLSFPVTEYSKFLYSSENPDYMDGKLIIISSNKVYKLDESDLSWDEVTDLPNIIFSKSINNEVFFISANDTGVPIKLIKTNDFKVFDTFNLIFEDVDPVAFNNNVIVYNATDAEGGVIYNTKESTLASTSYNDSILYFAINDLIYAKGYYYLTGYNSEGSSYYYKSGNLKDWSIKTFPYTGKWKFLLFGNDTFFTYTEENPGYTISSNDGEVWQLSDINLVEKFTKYTTGLFYDITANGQLRYFTSNNLDTLKIIELELTGLVPESVFFINNVIYFLYKDATGFYLFNVTGSNYNDIFNVHNINTVAHLTAEEKTAFNGKLSTTELTQKTDIMKSDNKTYTDGKIDGLNLTGLSDGIAALNNNVELHKANSVVHSVTNAGELWETVALAAGQTTIWDICYGNGIYAGVFSPQDIIRSVDGHTWTSHVTGAGTGMAEIIFANGMFVAVGNNGLVISSTDAITWTQNYIGVPESLSHILYGNGIYLAGGYNNMYISSDKITWTKITAITLAYIGEMIFANGMFTVMDSVTNKSYTSVDGINWNTIVSQSPILINAVAYGNGKYVLIKENNISVSTDLIAWQTIPITFTDWPRLYGHDIYFNDKFYAVFEAYSDDWELESGILATSVDGITWELTKLPSATLPYSIIKENDMLLVLMYNSILVSTSNQDIKTYWNAKAALTHQHIKDGNVQLDTADVTSGIIDIARLPAEVFDRVHTVVSNAARLALTKTQVQNGDSVHVYSADPVVNEWYRVIDDTKLSIEAGYRKFSENPEATEVDFSGVVGHPTSIAGYGITDLYTKTETENNINNIELPIKNTTDSKIIEYDQMLTVDGFTAYKAIEGSYSFIKIKYFNGKFIIFGYGSIYVSTDGFNWNMLDSDHYYDLDVFPKEIIYVDGLYIILDSTKRILTSPDLINWTLKATIGSSTQLTGIVYGNNLYVVCGDDGSIFTSPDLVAWTIRNSTAPITVDFIKIKFLNGIFFAISSEKPIYYSSDCITWATFTSASLFDIIYENNLFVTVGSNVVSRSIDGITWSQQTITSTYLRSVIYANNLFVAIGDGGKIISSPDGITWTVRDSDGCTDVLYDIIYDNNIFLISGTNVILTSSDGITWKKTIRTSETNFYIISDRQGPVYGNGVFVTYGSGLTIASYLGDKWIYGMSVDVPYQRWVTNGTIKIFLTLNRFMMISFDDGKTWEVPNYYFGESLRDIIYDNGQFVMVADASSIWTSPDGITWTLHIAPVVDDYWYIGYGNGLYVALGDNNDTLITSPDGVTWTDRTANITVITDIEIIAGWMMGVTYGNGKWMIVKIENDSTNTYYLHLITSTDGITWTERRVATEKELYTRDPIYADGRFVLVSSCLENLEIVISVSSDGDNWKHYSFETRDGDAYFLTYHDGIYNIVDSYGLYIIHFYINDGGANELVSKIYNTISDSENIIDLIEKDSIGIVTPPYPTVGLETSAYITSAKFLNGKFTILTSAYPANGVVHLSADGITWETHPITIAGSLYDISYGNGVYVVTGTSGKIFISTDNCVTWIDKSLADTSRRFWATTFAAGVFVIVGEYIYSSTDNGATWVETGLGVTEEALDDYIYDIKYGNGMFLAVAEGSLDDITWPYGGKVYKSLDGITWTKAFIKEGGGFMTIAYGDGLFALTEYTGKVLISADGVNWKEELCPTQGYPKPFIRANGRFMGPIGQDELLISIDGVTWKTLPVKTMEIDSVVEGNGKILALGGVPIQVADVTEDFNTLITKISEKFIADESSLNTVLVNSENALELI